MTLIAFQYIRYAIPSNGLFLGWDTPDYVRLANEVLIYGPAYTIGQWQYPQFYVLTLALIGGLVGVDNAERAIPLMLGMVVIIANYLITLRVCADRKIAALAALLTPLVLGNLKLIGDSHRNLMAYAIILSILASGFPVDGSFKVFRNPKLAYVPIGFLAAALTQFETFAFFGIVLLAASIAIRNYRVLLEVVTLVGIPSIILLLLFPSYFLGYFNTQVLLFRNPINVWDLVFWTGGTSLSLSLLILGGVYMFHQILRKRNLLVVVLFSWFAVTMLFFWMIALDLIPLGVDYALRASFILPSAVLIALSIAPISRVVLRILESFQSRISITIKTRRLAPTLIVIVLVGIVIFSSAIVTSFNYGIYLKPYATQSVTEELRLVTNVIGTNAYPEPVFVFQGFSIWHLGSYRSYVAAIVGPHFAYYGSIENLLQMKETNSTALDPQVNSMENFWGSAYFTELTTGYSKTSYLYIHKDAIKNSTQLLTHPIVVITQDFYSGGIPYSFLPVRVAQGVYVAKPGTLNRSGASPVEGPLVNLTEDGKSMSIYSQFVSLDSTSSQLAIVNVTPPSGATDYNLTGFPSDWRFLNLYQSGYLSSPEVSPIRLDGELALIGNDPSENVSNWRPIGQNVSLTLSQDRLEGAGSLLISGVPDSSGNLGATYSQSLPADLVRWIDLAFWAKCSDPSTLGLLLIDENYNSRTYYGIQTGGMSCDTKWQRFALDLTSWTNEILGFDSAHVVSFRFFSVHAASNNRLQLSLDDIVLDKSLTTSLYVFKGRVMPNDPVVFSFDATIPAAIPLPTQPASPGMTTTIVIFGTALAFPVVICVIRQQRKSKTSNSPSQSSV